MTYAAAWFLVSIASQQYIGPISQAECQQAGAALASQSIVCRRASALTACPVPGMPGMYTSCPVFDFPQVTARPEGER
jgi:hypothetical protein